MTTSTASGRAFDIRGKVFEYSSQYQRRRQTTRPYERTQKNTLANKGDLDCVSGSEAKALAGGAADERGRMCRKDEAFLLDVRRVTHPSQAT
jgi:hypothetical protein